MSTLNRTAFTFDRTLEFFTEAELRAQIGYNKPRWPIAILRELIDNALDASETGQPEIVITIDGDSFTVEDNGPGIPPEIIERSLDYGVRVSDKAAYIAPTRGAMGNALKVIWAAPFVDCGVSRAQVYGRGVLHDINIQVDRIRQQPDIRHTQTETNVKKRGFSKIRWPDSASRLLHDADDSFFQTADALVGEYAAFNPHAAFTLNGRRIERTTKSWKKWRASDPTPPAWYDAESLRNLIAAYVANQPDKTVREFVAEFRGLSGSAKQKAIGCTGYLRDNVRDGDINPQFAESLLGRMQEHTTAPKPTALGVIGKDHLTAWLRSRGVGGIRYKRIAGDDGMPYVIEVAFGINADAESGRRLVVGMNWSPTIGADPSMSLSNAVADMRIDRHDPVTLVCHITRPRFEFADRGKTRVMLSPNMAADLHNAVRLVGKSWKEAKRKADRQDRVSQRRLRAMVNRNRNISIREAAFRVMERAYNKASSHGKYYANARQIMYAARPDILKMTGNSTLNDVYFTQTLLKDYLEQYTPDWRVVWDARGNLIEPHTDHRVPLGGVGVQRYLDDWGISLSSVKPTLPRRINTTGPSGRYGNALFIEKEGFTETLQAAKIPERFDMALMSTKGVPVDAACDLIAALTESGVRVFVLHDFDLAGFKILRTLRKGTRLAEGADVIDLGLRIGDIDGLPSEPVTYQQNEDPSRYLRLCGASEGEIELLVSGGHPGGYKGERVEINAMTSEQLVLWLEAKFKHHDVVKTVPDGDVLADAFKRAKGAIRIQEQIANMKPVDVDVPDQLRKRVADILASQTNLSWDEAVWRVAEGAS